MRRAVANCVTSRLVALGLLLFGTVGCGSPRANNTRMVYTFAGAASGSLGNVTFTDFTSTAGIFVNQTFPAIGLQRLGNQAGDMLDIQDQTFATYDLKSAIGPVGSSSVVLGQFNCNFGCVETTMGALTLDSVASTTFAASAAP